MHHLPICLNPAPLSTTLAATGAPAAPYLRRAWPLLAAAALLGGCASAPQQPPPPASVGAAGGGASVGGDASLQQCENPVGTVRLQDGMKSSDTTQSQVAPNANIESVRLLLRDVGSLFGPKREGPDVSGALESMRLLIQQSNCFVIVDRGRDEGATSDEKRRNMTNTQVRDNPDKPRAQEVEADYVLRGTIIGLEQSKSSGFNLGSLLPGRLGAAAGSMGSTSSVSDARVQLVLSSIAQNAQVAVSQGAGSATNTKMAVNVLGLFTGKGAGGGGFTSEEKSSTQTIILQAFADAYNKLVPAVRGYKMQVVKGGLGGGGTLTMQGGRDNNAAPSK
jgi:curli biogenesis system outer membrane secretion channel CsgG